MSNVDSDRDSLERLVRARILRLNAMLHGVVIGLAAGAALFIATNWLVLKGGPVVGPHLALLGQYFPGYRVTLLGSVIGFGYAFVAGFFLAYAIATLYNRFAARRDRRRADEASHALSARRG